MYFFHTKFTKRWIFHFHDAHQIKDFLKQILYKKPLEKMILIHLSQWKSCQNKEEERAKKIGFTKINRFEHWNSTIIICHAYVWKWFFWGIIIPKCKRIVLNKQWETSSLSREYILCILLQHIIRNGLISVQCKKIVWFCLQRSWTYAIISTGKNFCLQNVLLWADINKIKIQVG